MEKKGDAKGNTMKRLENKFIVINKKRFREMLEEAEKAGGIAPIYAMEKMQDLEDSLALFQDAYERIVGKKMNQKYISINEDEEYAQEVVDIIFKDDE